MHIMYFDGCKPERQLQHETVEVGEGAGGGRGGGAGGAGGAGGGAGEAGDGDRRAECLAQFHIEVETNTVTRTPSRNSMFTRRPNGGVAHQKKSSDYPVIISPISSIFAEASSSTVLVQVSPKSSNYLKMDPNTLISQEIRSLRPSFDNANPFPDHRKSSRHLTSRLAGRGTRQDRKSEDQTKRVASLQSIQSPAYVGKASLPKAVNFTPFFDSSKGDNLSGTSQFQDFRSDKSMTGRPHSMRDNSDYYRGLAPSTYPTKASQSLDPNALRQLQTDCLSRSSRNSCPKLQITSTNKRHDNVSSTLSYQDHTKASNSLADLPACEPETERRAILQHLYSPSENYNEDRPTLSAKPESCRLNHDTQWKGKQRSISKRPTIPQDSQIIQDKYFEVMTPSNSASSKCTSSVTDNILSSSHFSDNQRYLRLNAPNELMDISWVESYDTNLSRADSVTHLGKILSAKNVKQLLADSALLSKRSNYAHVQPANNYSSSRITLDKDNTATDPLLAKLSANCTNKDTTYLNVSQENNSLQSNSNKSLLYTDVHRETLSFGKDGINGDRQFPTINQTSLKPKNNSMTIHPRDLAPPTGNDYHVSMEKNPKGFWAKAHDDHLKSEITAFRVAYEMQQQSRSAMAAANNAFQLRRSLTAVQNTSDQSSGALTTLPLTSVNRSLVRGISSTKGPGKTFRFKSSCTADFVKFIPVRLPLPIEIPRILHNRIDASEWQRAQKAFAKDQLGNVKKSQSLDHIQTIKSRIQPTMTMLNECRQLSSEGLCSKAQKPIDCQTTSMFSFDFDAFKEPKYREDTMLKFLDDKDPPCDCKCLGVDRMGERKQGYPLESELRFSMSANEDYCRLASQKQPDFTAVIYFERPPNYNQRLYLIKTELALAALIHFFHPCSSANVFWTTDIQKQMSAILNDRSNQIQIKTKFSRVSCSWETDQISTNPLKNPPQSVRTGIRPSSRFSRDRPELVRGCSRIGQDPSALGEPQTSDVFDVDYKCILLLSSDAGRLLRHKQTSLLPHIATALATDVEDVVILVKVSEK